MRHRIIQHSGRRFSVKLDDLVWNNLEALAAKADLRLNQLVSRVVERAGEGANITGALRQYCLDEALKHIRDLERAAEDRALSAGGVPITLFAEACPAPCLIVGVDHNVRRANAAACEWMGATEDVLIGKSVQHYFQIKAPQPLDEIARQYAAGKLDVFSARIVYVRPGRLVVARAKICPGIVHSPEDLAYLIMVDTGKTA
jgi:predicted DNA-binding ribbon-helix-helix protein